MNSRTFGIALLVGTGVLLYRSMRAKSDESAELPAGDTALRMATGGGPALANPAAIWTPPALRPADAPDAPGYHGTAPSFAVPAYALALRP